MNFERYTSSDLVALRKSTGQNQADFWGRIGVTQSGGCRYERGRNIPAPVHLLIQIAYSDSGKYIFTELRAGRIRPVSQNI